MRLTPRASGERIDGTVTDAGGARYLAVRVRAVPEKGKANEALLRLLADALNVPLKAVAIRSGHNSRLKIVAVAGEASALEPRLRAVAGG